MRFCHQTKVLTDFEYVTQYLVAFIVSVGLLVEGMHYGWSSSAIPKLLENKSNVQVSGKDANYITEMFAYGSITYTILSFADYPKLSQKIGVLVSVIFMALSWIFIATSQSAILLMVARFFAGIGRGLVYQISVNYICEIADPKIRGFLSSLLYIMTNLGLFFIYTIGPYVDILCTSIIGILLCLFQLIAIKWIPESPYILLLRGKTGHARRVLKSLRNLWNVEYELDTIFETVKKQDEENSSFWSLFTVESNRRALTIMLILSWFQILSGINIFIHQILKPSGGTVDTYKTAMVTSLASVVSCTIAAILLDIVGRRPILIVSFAVSGLSLLILASYVYINNELHIDIKNLHIIPTGCLVTYTMVYKMGIGMIPLLMSGELFPMNAKNSSSAICGIFSIIFAYVSILMLKWIEVFLGYHIVFLISALFSLTGIFYTYFFVPETSNISLEEIQFKLKNNII